MTLVLPKQKARLRPTLSRWKQAGFSPSGGHFPCGSVTGLIQLLPSLHWMQGRRNRRRPRRGNPSRNAALGTAFHVGQLIEGFSKHGSVIRHSLASNYSPKLNLRLFRARFCNSTSFEARLHGIAAVTPAMLQNSRQIAYLESDRDVGLQMTKRSAPLKGRPLGTVFSHLRLDTRVRCGDHPVRPPRIRSGARTEIVASCRLWHRVGALDKAYGGRRSARPVALEHQNR